MRTKYTARSATLPALLLLAAVTACGDKGSQQAGAIPAREIQLAPSAPAQPQLNDAPAQAAVAPAPKKVASKPVQIAKAPEPAQPPAQEVVVRPLSSQENPPLVVSPVPAATGAGKSEPLVPGGGNAPGPAMGTVVVGTSFAVRPIARVCTNTFKTGDRFTAILSESVAGIDGAIIPSGSSVVLKVDESTRSENSKDSLKLTFSVVSIRIGQQSYDVTGHVSQTTALEKVRVQSTTDQAKKVGAGAVLGALAGQLLGKNTKSTVIGAAAGAAAGAAVAVGTADYDGCVPTTSGLNVILDAPLRIRLLPN
jgi:hypothetical protein